MRIATWNLWRPAKEGDRVDALLQQIEEIDADVWILTETRTSIDLTGSFTPAASKLIDLRHRPGESRTTIWSRLPVLQRLETHDEETAVCVEIATPSQPVLVYGTVLPYGGAGCKFSYRSAGDYLSEMGEWNLHYQSIDKHCEDLRSLRSRFPTHGFCFAGDFNQSRDGRKWGSSGVEWYGTKTGRDKLTQCLLSVGLKCMTDEDFVASRKLASKSTIDHICLDQSLADKCCAVGAWEAGLVNGKKISDHNGVHVDIT